MIAKHRSLSILFTLVLVFSLALSGCQTAALEATSEILPGETEAVDPGTEESASPATEEQAETDLTQAAPQTGQENIAVYATSTTYPNLDPSVSVSNENVVLANVYELLVYSNPPGEEEIVRPGLAREWESNEDGTIWTFYLREGVKFHDGTDLTSDIVKRSIERTRELGEGFAYIWDPVEEILTPDDLTIQFNLSYPAAMDLIAASTYAAWIFNPDANPENTSDWFNIGNDAGTGPYLIESYEIGQRMILRRFDDYWGGWSEGQIDRVVFEAVEDPVVRQQMIETGDADVTLKLPRENLATLEELPEITVYTNPGLTNLLALFNTQKPPLDNPLVRQAISYTFPYDQVIEGVMMGYAMQAHGPVPVGLWGGHSQELPQYTYDLDRARELLEEAGVGDGGFELLLTYATGDLDEQQLAELWQAELAKLNITLNAQAMAWEAQWDLAKTGQVDPSLAQDILVWYWWPDVLTPYSMLRGQFHCGEDVVYNMAYYCNPELDQKMDEANQLTASDRSRAEELFLEAEQILIDEAVALYIYDMETTMVMRSDLQGFVDNPAYAEVVFFYELTR